MVVMMKLIQVRGQGQRMETFTAIKKLLEDPQFASQRERSLDRLDINAIDVPIRATIRSIAGLPYCFTLQCCFGHFLYAGQNNRHNLDPLPVSSRLTNIEYRIAYVALCIDNSPSGKRFLENLEQIPAIDPQYIQFGCAEWFWARQVNSYALQVEPIRFMAQDTCVIEYHEARHIEKIRNQFFAQLDQLLQEHGSVST
jgi:hypothetical protein